MLDALFSGLTGTVSLVALLVVIGTSSCVCGLFSALAELSLLLSEHSGVLSVSSTALCSPVVGGFPSGSSDTELTDSSRVGLTVVGGLTGVGWALLLL